MIMRRAELGVLLVGFSLLLAPSHPAPSPAPTGTEPRYRRVCYYTNWSQYRKDGARFLPANIDPFLCTHIVFAFAKLDHNGQLAPYEWNDVQYPYVYRQFTSLKQKNPALKALLAVGGWTHGSGPFTQMVQTRKGRQSFMEHALQYLRTHQFDGLDLDWEYPANRGSPLEDKDNFSMLLKELREGFEQEAARTGKPRLLLTAAVAGGEKVVITAYDVPKLDKYLDFINLMSYDLHGSWSKYLGHNSPLYGGDYNTDEPTITHSVDQSVQLWLRLGASRDKLVMGVPMYGRTFTLCSVADTRPGMKNCGSGKAATYTQEKGFVSFYEMEAYLADGWERVWLEEEKVPYAFHPASKQWVGYDDINSIQIKAQYIKDQGLGGAMVWAIDLDDFAGLEHEGAPYPLGRALRQVLTDDQQFPEFHPPPVPSSKKKISTPKVKTADEKFSFSEKKKTESLPAPHKVHDPSAKFSKILVDPKATVKTEHVKPGDKEKDTLHQDTLLTGLSRALGGTVTPTPTTTTTAGTVTTTTQEASTTTTTSATLTTSTTTATTTTARTSASASTALPTTKPAQKPTKNAPEAASVSNSAGKLDVMPSGEKNKRRQKATTTTSPTDHTPKPARANPYLKFKPQIPTSTPAPLQSLSSAAVPTAQVKTTTLHKKTTAANPYLKFRPDPVVTTTQTSTKTSSTPSARSTSSRTTTKAARPAALPSIKTSRVDPSTTTLSTVHTSTTTPSTAKPSTFSTSTAEPSTTTTSTLAPSTAKQTLTTSQTAVPSSTPSTQPTEDVIPDAQPTTVKEVISGKAASDSRKALSAETASRSTSTTTHSTPTSTPVTESKWFAHAMTPTPPSPIPLSPTPSLSLPASTTTVATPAPTDTGDTTSTHGPTPSPSEHNKGGHEPLAEHKPDNMQEDTRARASQQASIFGTTTRRHFESTPRPDDSQPVAQGTVDTDDVQGKQAEDVEEETKVLQSFSVTSAEQIESKNLKRNQSWLAPMKKGETVVSTAGTATTSETATKRTRPAERTGIAKTGDEDKPTWISIFSSMDKDLEADGQLDSGKRDKQNDAAVRVLNKSPFTRPTRVAPSTSRRTASPTPTATSVTPTVASSTHGRRATQWWEVSYTPTVLSPTTRTDIRHSDADPVPSTTTPRSSADNRQHGVTPTRQTSSTPTSSTSMASTDSTTYVSSSRRRGDIDSRELTPATLSLPVPFSTRRSKTLKPSPKQHAGDKQQSETQTSWTSATVEKPLRPSSSGKLRDDDKTKLSRTPVSPYVTEGPDHKDWLRPDKLPATPTHRQAPRRQYEDPYVRKRTKPLPVHSTRPWQLTPRDGQETDTKLHLLRTDSQWTDLPLHTKPAHTKWWHRTRKPAPWRSDVMQHDVAVTQPSTPNIYTQTTKDCDKKPTIEQFKATDPQPENMRAGMEVTYEVKHTELSPSFVTSDHVQANVASDRAPSGDNVVQQIGEQKSSYQPPMYYNPPHYEFECPTVFGIYMDPSDCHRFYQCVWLVAFHHVCGPGTVWNDDMKICDWPSASTCRT